MTDPYSVLGVTRDASDEEITRAYRALARKYHPDLHPGDRRAELNMKNLNAAYMQIQDIRNGKSARATEGWGGSESPGDTYSGGDRSGRYGGDQGGNYGGFGGGYYNPYSGGFNPGQNSGNYRRRAVYGSYGLTRIPFMRIILAIIIIRFVFSVILSLFYSFGDYSEYPEGRSAYRTAEVYDQSGAQSVNEDVYTI